MRRMVNIIVQSPVDGEKVHELLWVIIPIDRISGSYI